LAAWVGHQAKIRPNGGLTTHYKIQKFTSLLSLPPEIRLIIGWGSDSSTVSFTAGAEIARLKTAQEQKFLATAILEHQLNIPEVKQVIQIRQRSRRSIEDSVESVLKQRPIIERRHLVIGKLLSKQLEQYLQEIDQQRRNDLLNRALERQGLGIPTYGAKLNSEYFLIVCDEDYHKALLSLPDGLEKAITRQLLETHNNEE
jgi:hypothetical protein